MRGKRFASATMQSRLDLFHRPTPFTDLANAKACVVWSTAVHPRPAAAVPLLFLSQGRARRWSLELTHFEDSLGCNITSINSLYGRGGALYACGPCLHGSATVRFKMGT